MTGPGLHADRRFGLPRLLIKSLHQHVQSTLYTKQSVLTADARPNTRQAAPNHWLAMWCDRHANSDTVKARLLHAQHLLHTRFQQCHCMDIAFENGSSHQVTMTALHSALKHNSTLA